MLDSEKPGGAGQEIPIPKEDSYSEDGVDLALIRWMLSLTPEEGLEALLNSVRSVMELRGAIRRS